MVIKEPFMFREDTGVLEDTTVLYAAWPTQIIGSKDSSMIYCRLQDDLPKELELANEE